jgi:hypothetical protein
MEPVRGDASMQLKYATDLKAEDESALFDQGRSSALQSLPDASPKAARSMVQPPVLSSTGVHSKLAMMEVTYDPVGVEEVPKEENPDHDPIGASKIGVGIRQMTPAADDL